MRNVFQNRDYIILMDSLQNRDQFIKKKYFIDFNSPRSKKIKDIKYFHDKFIINATNIG